MLATDYCHAPQIRDTIGGGPLSRAHVIRLVRERMTLCQQEALLALDRNGAITTVDPRHRHFLAEIRRLRIDHHLIAELALPAASDHRWFITKLGRAVRDHLECDPL